MKFISHDVDWTNEKVEIFWSEYSKSTALSYFAEEVGEQVVEYAQTHHAIGERVLDYGCGRGFLINCLIASGVKNVSGCDFSVDSVLFVNKNFLGKNGFVECRQIEKLPTSFEDNSFDTIFFLETIEHLLPEVFEPTLKELHRLLKPNGTLVVTTPHNENIDSMKVVCPDCGARFHRYQHMRSFTASSICEDFKKVGFSTVVSRDVDFEEMERNEFVQFAKKVYRILAKRKRTGVNLVYIGKKTKGK